MTTVAPGARRPIARRPTDAPAPLSFAQQRLWFVHQLDPQRPGISTPLALRLEGPLDVVALRRALDAIVARHDAFRTRVTLADDGEPQQVLDDDARLVLSIDALPGDGAANQEAAMAAYLAAVVRRPFDLATAPLACATLVGCGPTSHVLVLTVHHLVFDAWSRGIVRRELAAAYAAIVAGEVWAPAAVPIRFADYAAWQRDEDAEDTLAADEAFWVAALDGAPLVLPLPAAREGRPGGRVTDVRLASVQLPRALTDSLRAFARSEGATPFMVLLAAYEAVLARYTGLDDFLVGVLVSGRTRTEMERVVGCFVNTLPLRARVDGDPSARALLARVRTAAARAFAHQAVPFERLVARLNPARDAMSAPLVQATFNYRNVAFGEVAIPGLTVTALPVPAAPETPGLSLDVDDATDGMHAALSYDARRITGDVAEALLADFAAVIAAAIASPAAPLSTLTRPEFPRPAAADRPSVDPPAAHAPAADAPVTPERAAFDALYARSNLSATQLLMWLHGQRHADVPLYNQTALRIWEEPADAAAFGRAFAALVASSEALRTTVAERDGIPWQTVHPAGECPAVYDVLDFSARPDPLAALRTWAADRAASPLDLTRCSYDSVLVVLGAARCAWYFATHHVVSDGSLRAMLQREMYTDYVAERTGGRAAPREARPSFAEVVAAERVATASVSGMAGLVLASDDDAPVRPYGCVPRGGVGPVTRVSVSLGAERTAALRSLVGQAAPSTHRADVRVANLCAAALCVTLHRVGGGTAVTLGVPLHNRRTDAARRTHGLMMCVVPVRVRVDDTLAVGAVAEALADATVHAAAGAACGAGALAAAGADAVFNFHPPVAVPIASGWVEWLHPGWAAEPLAVSFHDYQSTGALTLTADFRDDVYDVPTRALFVRHMLAVIDAMLADPSTRVGDVELLSADERRRVLVVPNDTAVPLPMERTIVDLIFAQGSATPDAIAVSQPDATGGARTLTYAALIARAERLAAGLHRLGVGRGDCVGLVLGRSPDLIVAMLGVLRAGAAYVPLDPSYPESRLAFMVDDARIALCITERAVADRVPVGAAHTVCVDTLEAGHDVEVARELPRPARDDLAYVIYTSGSTGRPKGVEITHAALLNFSADVARRFALGPADRFLQFASPSFDTAVEEIFPSLVCGGAVVLRDDAWIGSLPAFVARCAAAEITVFSLPTAFWHELADALARGTVVLPPCLRLALAGGERMRADRLAQWRRAVGSRVALWNGYGPTEATVVTHFCDLTPIAGRTAATDEVGGVAASTDVPIGTPIANMRAYVLDAARRPTPLGVPGELYVGGIGLARGYRGQPELTAERFVDDPFAPGSRLYGTGDLARVRPDGALEVLGRADAQVKVRGFRVEPGEVEAALLAIAAVRDAAVVARDDGRTGARLVGYVVRDDAAATPAAVRATVYDALRHALPEHMVPAAIVVLPSLPHTPNGKVDRRALPEPSGEDAGAPSTAFIAPRTLAERTVATIWAELLGVPAVGVHDDFFDLGGHSLLAVRVMSRMRDAIGADVPLRALFDARTVERMAALLVETLRTPADAAEIEPVVAVQESGTRTPLFWLHGDYGAGGMYCRNLSRTLGPDQPFYAVHPLGFFNDHVPYTIEAMAARHVADIRAIRPNGPYRLGGHCNGGVLAFEVARRLRACGAVVEGVVLVDAATRNAPFPALRRLRFHVSRPLGRATRRWLRGATPPDLRGTRDPDARRAVLDDIYGAALWTYLPRAYAGRVVALLSTSKASPGDEDHVTAGLRRAAPSLEVGLVSGDHFGCITTHVDELAARVRAAFDDGVGAEV